MAWTYDTAEDGPRTQFHGDAIIVGNGLVLPSDGEPSAHIYSFAAATGKLNWRMAFEGGVATTPLLIERSVIVTSATGKLARIDLESGKTEWTATPAGTRSSIPRIPSPAADTKRVYFASNDAKLFAVDAASGEVVWRRDLAARINTSLMMHDKTLYAGAGDGHLYAFDPASGEVRQRIVLGGNPSGTLVVAPPLMVILVNGKPAKLVAVDLTTNKLRWQRTTESEWTTMKPLVQDDTVIAGTEERELCAFAIADGVIRWCTAVPQIPRGLGTAGGMLYVGTLNGKVLAYRLPE